MKNRLLNALLSDLTVNDNGYIESAKPMASRGSVAPLSQRLCKNDNLSAGRVFLHNAVCFNDLV
jgi:hypothetical protein